MDKKKTYILVVVILLLIVVSLIAIVISQVSENNGNINNINNTNTSGNYRPNEPVNNTAFLIIDNTDMFTYNGSWRKLKEFENVSEKLKVYINNDYYGDYYLRYINAWNLFDENNNYVNYNGLLLAASSSLNLKIRDYNKTKIDENDLNDINNIIGSTIDYNSLIVNEKVEIDLDNNGVVDSIINVSNIDYESDNNSIYFNLLYVVLNGEKNTLIKETVDVRDLLSAPVYNINYILNINESNNILIEQGFFSLGGTTGNIMYQLRGSSFRKLIDNE